MAQKPLKSKTKSRALLIFAWMLDLSRRRVGLEVDFGAVASTRRISGGFRSRRVDASILPISSLLYIVTGDTRRHEEIRGEQSASEEIRGDASRSVKIRGNTKRYQEMRGNTNQYVR